MDVEGFEFRALEGAKTIIDLYKPVLMLEIVETHQARYGKKPSDIYEWLKTHNYSLDNIIECSQYDLVSYP